MSVYPYFVDFKRREDLGGYDVNLSTSTTHASPVGPPRADLEGKRAENAAADYDRSVWSMIFEAGNIGKEEDNCLRVSESSANRLMMQALRTSSASTTMPLALAHPPVIFLLLQSICPNHCVNLTLISDMVLQKRQTTRRRSEGNLQTLPQALHEFTLLPPKTSSMNRIAG